ncbi:ABC transporter ATP-binding protein [Dactylosporangium sp. CA-092794]|uniref:ABC transporter ATP-binding protein n=1 Tax=Dactylosporangium sp. CA-092794 TaxID=3239929 RepID=UPI003D8A1EAC
MSATPVFDRPDGAPLLQVRDLRTQVRTARGPVRAVDGVSFDVMPGETLGIVGESGSGKTMTALSILRLLPRRGPRIVGGEIRFNGVDLVTLPDRDMRMVRGRHISMILQDPHTSLNPVFTIGNQVIEALATAGEGGGEPRQRAVAALRDVRIAAPESRLRAYPHQLSGGMKQRVVGAIATAGAPELLIADEPTTALDVTIQLQYLDLLRGIQERTGMAILFITHDFGIVAKMCDRVAVMYAGRIVEQGPVRDIFDHPAHPYTEALIASVPKLTERVDRLYSLGGYPPDPAALPVGCRFADRCRHARPQCTQQYPEVYDVSLNHTAACWRLDPSWPA